MTFFITASLRGVNVSYVAEGSFESFQINLANFMEVFEILC